MLWYVNLYSFRPTSKCCSFCTCPPLGVRKTWSQIGGFFSTPDTIVTYCTSPRVRLVASVHIQLFKMDVTPFPSQSVDRLYMNLKVVAFWQRIRKIYKNGLHSFWLRQHLICTVTPKKSSEIPHKSWTCHDWTGCNGLLVYIYLPLKQDILHTSMAGFLNQSIRNLAEFLPESIYIIWVEWEWGKRQTFPRYLS